MKRNESWEVLVLVAFQPRKYLVSQHRGKKMSASPTCRHDQVDHTLEAPSIPCYTPGGWGETLRESGNWVVTEWQGQARARALEYIRAQGSG